MSLVARGLEVKWWACYQRFHFEKLICYTDAAAYTWIRVSLDTWILGSVLFHECESDGRYST